MPAIASGAVIGLAQTVERVALIAVLPTTGTTKTDVMSDTVPGPHPLIKAV